MLRRKINLSSPEKCAPISVTWEEDRSEWDWRQAHARRKWGQREGTPHKRKLKRLKKRCQIFPTCGVGAAGVTPKLPCLSRLNTSFHKTMSRTKVYEIAQWAGNNYRESNLISHSCCWFCAQRWDQRSDFCETILPLVCVLIIRWEVGVLTKC